MKSPAEQIVCNALEAADRQQLNLGQVGMVFIVAGVMAISKKQPIDALMMVDRILDECRSEQLQRTPCQGTS